ncbi:Auxin-responsive protein SAUR71 [Bienertia sinuspersici]
MESSKQSNKISDIVRLKQKLKKWRNQAHNAQINNSNSNSSSSSSSNTKKGSLSRSNSIKGITFLKRTLSFTDASFNNGFSSNGFPPMDEARSNNSNSNSSSSSNTKSNSSKGNVSSVSSNNVPKGFLAVHVGVEMKRFVIPTNYLSHQAFCTLLKEAEEEFGFQQEGVLRIPCEVEVFENILRSVEEKNNSSNAKQGLKFNRNDGIVCGSSESLSQSHHPPSPMCR